MIALWYVPDEVAADTVRAALALDWPDRPAEVRVGARPAGELAVEWDGATVRTWDEEGLRLATAADAEVAVLWVRSWTFEPTAAGPERFLPGPLPAPLPELEVWVPSVPPPPPSASPDARVATVQSGSSTVLAPPVRPDVAHTAVGIGSRQALDEPLSLVRGRLVLEAVRRAAFTDLAACAWGAVHATRFVGRVHGGEQAVELGLDRAAFSWVGGWRREGKLPLYAYGGPELRLVEWQLYVNGSPSGGVQRELAPALIVGAGAGRVFGPLELRALPYFRATTAAPHATVGVNLDLLVRSRRVTPP